MTLLVIVSSVAALIISIHAFLLNPIVPTHPTWSLQSIDTVKTSRDQARRNANNSHYLTLINTQVRQIAETGANYVAIGTPYDEEFIPVIHLWVDAARRNRLHVWFRGNFSGWEKWFDYSTITPDEHTQLTKEFILSHPDLFEDEDIFTSCPECENGSIGDPRRSGQVTEFRQFLITEKQTADDAFQKINKKVTTGYYSMNYDVASLIMDKETTASLGGVVTLDHYTKTPDQLITDINTISNQAGGKVVLGEIGAPVLDIHGPMTDQEQSYWLNETLRKLSQEKQLIGLNYWTNTGSSTALWLENYTPRPSLDILKTFYSPRK